MEAEVILNTRKLDIGYGNTCIAKNLMLSLYAGEMVCLIGPNGCGKSTLIRTLVGLQDALGGKIEIKNKKLNKISLSEKSKLISWVLTDTMPTGSLKVSEIVEMGRFPYTNWFGKLSEKDKNIIGGIEMTHTLVTEEVPQRNREKDIDEFNDKCGGGQNHRAFQKTFFLIAQKALPFQNNISISKFLYIF